MVGPKGWRQIWDRVEISLELELGLVLRLEFLWKDGGDLGSSRRAVDRSETSLGKDLKYYRLLPSQEVTQLLIKPQPYFHILKDQTICSHPPTHPESLNHVLF